MAEKRVSPSVEVRDESEGTITKMADLTAPQEVVVDEIVQPVRAATTTPMVVIRVNDNIENMSHVAGGRRESYTFETGHRYRVPVYIAQELEASGRLWH